MSNSISTLLLRNLSDVFGENDPVRRRAAIDEIFHEDAVFTSVPSFWMPDKHQWRAEPAQRQVRQSCWIASPASFSARRSDRCSFESLAWTLVYTMWCLLANSLH